MISGNVHVDTRVTMSLLQPSFPAAIEVTQCVSACPRYWPVDEESSLPNLFQFILQVCNMKPTSNKGPQGHESPFLTQSDARTRIARLCIGIRYERSTILWASTFLWDGEGCVHLLTTSIKGFATVLPRDHPHVQAKSEFYPDAHGVAFKHVVLAPSHS